MANHFLNYLHTTLQLTVEEDAIQFVQPILTFFRHNISGDAKNRVTFDLRFKPFGPDQDQWMRRPDAVPTIIRRSRAPSFNIDAVYFLEDHKIYYVNENTALIAPRAISAYENELTIFLSENSKVQVIELIRDLIIRHEETCGTFVLHATGVYRESQLVLISGAAGAGKTTLMLEMLDKGNWSYFSGDKVFCQVSDNQIFVTPWRDWPHVGIGTIKQFEWLQLLVKKHLNLDLGSMSDQDKVLIDPDVFETAIDSQFSAQSRRLNTIVFPDVLTARMEQTGTITSPNEKWARLNKVVERSIDTTYFLWQTFLVPDYYRLYEHLHHARNALEDIAFIQVQGKANLYERIRDLLGQ